MHLPNLNNSMCVLLDIELANCNQYIIYIGQNIEVVDAEFIKNRIKTYTNPKLFFH